MRIQFVIKNAKIDFLIRVWRFVFRENSSKNTKKSSVKNKSNDNEDKPDNIENRSNLAYALLANSNKLRT